MKILPVVLRAYPNIKIRTKSCSTVCLSVTTSILRIRHVWNQLIPKNEKKKNTVYYSELFKAKLVYFGIADVLSGLPLSDR